MSFFVRVALSLLVRSIKGTSDHGGCIFSTSRRGPITPPRSASSVIRQTPVVSPILPANSGTLLQVSHPTPWRLSRSQINDASRPTGATTSARCSLPCSFIVVGVERLPIVNRNPAQHAPEIAQRLTDADACWGYLEFADRALVPAIPILDHRYSLLDLAFRFKVPEQNQTVYEIADIRWRPHVREHPVLRHRHQC